MIDKKTKQIIKEVINEKKLAIIRHDSGNKQIKLDKNKASSKALDAKELSKLVKISLLIEKHYKKPMDIEWAIDDKLYILQARPITTI